MPIIPLLNPSPTPLQRGPAPVLDRERRPTVDTRGIAGAVAGVADAAGQLARASRMPDLPDELANGYRALGPAGAAIMDAGGVLGALAIKRKEAESIAQVAEAEAAVDAEEADFENWKMQNPDPATWEGEWQTRLGKIQSLAADEKLNYGAREKLGVLMKQYSGKSSVRVARDASTMTFQRASRAMTGSIASSIDKGELDQARAKINEASTGGYIFDDRKQDLLSAVDEAERKRIETQAENLLMEGDIEGAKTAFQSPLFSEEDRKNKVLRIDRDVVRGNQQGEFIKLADEAPDEALKKIEDPANFHLLEAPERIRLKDFAERRMNEYGANEAATAELAIIDLPPEKIKDATIDSLGVNFKYASPLQIAPIKSKLAVKQGKAAINDKPTFERAVTEAMSYNPDDDPKGIKAVYMLQNYGELFDGDMLSKLKGEIEKRQKRPPNTPTEATDIGPAMALIQESALSGGLIPVERPVMADGKQVYRDPKPAGFVEGTKERPAFNPLELLPFGFLTSSDETVTVPTGRIDLKENDGKPVPQTEVDKVALAKVTAVQRAIRETLQAEVEAGKLKDQEAIKARAFDLWDLRGGKRTPVVPPTGPDANGMPTGGGVPLRSNPLLPSVKDIIESLRK